MLFRFSRVPPRGSRSHPGHKAEQKKELALAMLAPDLVANDRLVSLHSLLPPSVPSDRLINLISLSLGQGLLWSNMVRSLLWSFLLERPPSQFNLRFCLGLLPCCPLLEGVSFPSRLQCWKHLWIASTVKRCFTNLQIQYNAYIDCLLTFHLRVQLWVQCRWLLAMIRHSKIVIFWMCLIKIWWDWEPEIDIFLSHDPEGRAVSRITWRVCCLDIALLLIDSLTSALCLRQLF